MVVATLWAPQHVQVGEPDALANASGAVIDIASDHEPADDDPADDRELAHDGLANLILDDILEDVIARWIEKLPDTLLIRLVEGFRSMCTCHESTLPVGTAFAGCDVVMKVLKKLETFFAKAYDLHIRFVHTWAAEIDETKQAFLKEQSKPQLLFADVNALAGTSAYDLISKSMQLIPWTSLVFAGFPCQAKSSLNKSRAQHATCIQDGTASTGISQL